MKHTPPTLTKKYMPLILWRDDLDELASILKRRGAELEIKHGDYAYESIEELTSHIGPRDQTNLRISSIRPYVSIDLDDINPRLSVSGDHPDASGIFFELDKLLSARQRHWPFVYSFWFLNVTILVLFAFSWVLLYLQAAPSFRIAVLAAQIAMFVWGAWVLFVRLKRGSIVRMERRATASSFLRRNKDELIRGLILAIVAAAVGAAATKLVEKITTKIDTNQTPAGPSP